ncbi:hypothetical protein K388_06993 [Streptomyces sp. KhCrAH-43]|uniref:hypothetical protein n=1 Tax=unclassified Streptomyces TaxID=2593676 RepID=UPI0003677D11|nr:MULTISPECIES: hypothetical protein [unclassified Streptomyces]MYS36320.1 hypothetical protein [Streptomyces sp. SID4920]MYX63689.1 hypothetical protein [Streptomyces sp. SID8373]RAJ48565.1 hypothetical protein K388_06993 [Streptomyces sp. KhCrAH-43]
MDVVDAVRLAKTNRGRRKRLLECEDELDRRAAEENAASQKARQTLYDEALVPFRDVYQRLKHVDLVELAAIEKPAVGDMVGIEPRRPRKMAVPSAVRVLAGGALLVAVPFVVGHAAKAGSYRAVQTFGSASTGRSIKTLHGAAARNAAEAWFGRGPIAAGGGGRVAGKRMLDTVETTSVNLTQKVIAKWQIQALEDSRRKKARDLERRETKTKMRQDEAPALHERRKDMERVLQGLRFELVRRLPSFTTLVEACDDFTQYDSRQRAEVAAMVDLDGLAVMVMKCPITDADGRVTEESGRVVADAEARLRAVETDS